MMTGFFLAGPVFAVEPAIGGAAAPTTATVEGSWEQLLDGSTGQITEFQGQGGVKIAAYIRKPAERKPAERKPAGSGPFPVVVMLHGANDSREGTYGMGRSQKSPTQDFIAAGWAVLSIDFRPKADTPAPGSTPPDANPLWDDAIAGVAKARSYPFIDPKRVAILGGSRGGQIMSRLASRVDASCGVLCAPAGLDLIEIAKVIQKGEQINPALKAMVKALERRTSATIAQIEKEPDKYGYCSALTEAPKVRFPLLIISGRNDSSSPLAVVEAYARKLRESGKEVETYLPDNGPHGFYFGFPKEIPETKEAAQRAVAFLLRHFGP